MGLRAVIQQVVSFANQTFSNPTFTGAAGFDAGSATAPSIAWTADQDGSGAGFYRSSANVVTVTNNGAATASFLANEGIRLGSALAVGWSSAASPVSAGADATLGRAGANSVVFGPSSAVAGGATTRIQGNKAVAFIANAVATDVLTVTIPNAAHSASLKVKVIGSLGAGGAIGANEASATNTYDIIITRTAGVATVVAISSAYGAAASAVAGAATVTATAAVTAMSGAVGATQTFTVQVTISRSGGSSTNHTCLVYYELMNANTTGVTIA